MLFADRADAGRRLAHRLAAFRDEDVVVLGLPRGGVAVAFEVAEALDAPLDVIVVRKLGVPSRPELAMGAIGEGRVRLLNPAVVRANRVTETAIAEVERRERMELDRRAELLRGHRPGIPLTGRTAVVVDDGLATGASARVACTVARAEGAARVVVAVPVGPLETVEALRADADEVICLAQPRWFAAIGQFYDDFRQVPDEVVVSLLRRASWDPRTCERGPIAAVTRTFGTAAGPPQARR